MALPVDPRLALGTLHALAARQGRTTDPVSEEEPGRIPHEIRADWGPASRLAGRDAYYGTADATPLFVMLLGELYRWGFAEEARPLLPAADRALDWITRQEFVTYMPSGGLANQGWKDSPDAVSWAGGTLAEPPIALCEVQAYVYGAYRARADIARAEDDPPAARGWDRRAAEFRRAFHERFWLDGYVAFALDGTGRPVDTPTSNAAHCLWTGILDDTPARHVAEQLTSPALFTGWGVRTLSSRAGRYDPVSYHNGSVWPHDTAIAVAGLARYGFTSYAARIATSLLDAAPHFGGRLPEVFCGFDRAEFTAPVPYPSSCSPQAWAAAAPFLLIRSLLRLDPCVPDGVVRLAPALPAALGTVRIEGLQLGGHRIDVTARGSRGEVTGLPPGLASPAWRGPNG
jgi:glycogen debranching enzyme